MQRTIKADLIPRVEGEGAYHVTTKDSKVVDSKFKIIEAPRFFEAFLYGRKYFEAPDITSRICGICPIAYQMSACHAMEDGFGLKVSESVRTLRRLIYCGEWIESHGLHIYLLHGPDFLGYLDAIRMAKDYRKVVETGLQLKKIGNELVAKLGGREIHPINIKIGGFYKAPEKSDLYEIHEKLKWARDAAIDTVRWTAKLPFPDFERDYEFVSLRSERDEYPMNTGRLVSNKGLDLGLHDYDQNFEETQVDYSNAFQSDKKNTGEYFMGPLARFNLNYDRLSPLAKKLAEEVRFKPICNNPFKSIIARAVEVLYACDQAVQIIDDYQMPEMPFDKFEVKPSTGYGCTEAPRGSLYHRYTVDKNGCIINAKIVPPTSQNQKVIESDLKKFVEKNMNESNEKLEWQCEQLIRNYDPCISCATHSLKVKIRRL